MSKTLLQIDFPFAGPFGGEMAAAMEGLARDIAGEAGLEWKLWTENATEGKAGGVYLFSDAANAARYLDKHTKRLESFGISGIRALTFSVNPSLSAITRADFA